MNISTKINQEVKFSELFEQTVLNQTLKNAIQHLDYEHPTHCEEHVLQAICPTEEYFAQAEKKRLKKLKKEEKKLKKASEEIEEEEVEEKKSKKQKKKKSSDSIVEDKEEEEKEENTEEKEVEQQQVVKKQQIVYEKDPEIEKTAKQFIVQSGYQAGKSTALLLAQINDFQDKISKFDFKLLQKDQDEATHGLFSVVLCQSKDSCQQNAALAENLLLKFKKKKEKKQQTQELSQAEKNINSNIQVYNLATLEKKQTPTVMPNKNYIIVATPAQFLKFAKTMKIEQKYYVNFGLDDLDYMFSFGYQTDLDDFCFHFQHELLTNLVIITVSSEIKDDLYDFQQKLALYAQTIVDPNSVNEAEEEEDEENMKKTVQAFERDYRIVSQFYHIGDETTKYINLYILYKLQFLAGKSLIVCPDLDSVYKVYLFLGRIGSKNFQVMNDEDPKSLRYYVLSMFNTGVISTMICTEKVFDDLSSKIFYQKKRKILQFKSLNNIILLNLNKKITPKYNELYKHFRGSEGTIISLVDPQESQVDMLTGIISEQKRTFSQINIKEFPLKKHEIESFKYRINDVVSAISRKQIKNVRMLDFKKKMLKSKDLEKYFEENKTDRQMIVEEINSLSQQIHRYSVKCEQEIPDYLVPEMVKEQRKKFSDSNKEDKFSKIKITQVNDDFKKSLKRRMEKNNLTLDDVKKKKILNNDQDKYVYVNNEKEKIDGDEVDVSKLKIISGRKLWKQRHGFKNQKRNRRLERKGVYNS